MIAIVYTISFFPPFRVLNFLDMFQVPIEAEYECLLEGLGEGGTDLHYKSKLGPWLSNQRQRHRGSKGKQKLSPEREALLQGLVDQGTDGLCSRLGVI